MMAFGRFLHEVTATDFRPYHWVHPFWRSRTAGAPTATCSANVSRFTPSVRQKGAGESSLDARIAMCSSPYPRPARMASSLGTKTRSRHLGHQDVSIRYIQLEWRVQEFGQGRMGIGSCIAGKSISVCVYIYVCTCTYLIPYP